MCNSRFSMRLATSGIPIICRSHGVRKGSVRATSCTRLGSLGLSGNRALPALRRCLSETGGLGGAGLVFRLGSRTAPLQSQRTTGVMISVIGNGGLAGHARCVTFDLRTTGRLRHLSPGAPICCLGNSLSPGRLGRLNFTNLSCGCGIVRGRPR